MNACKNSQQMISKTGQIQTYKFIGHRNLVLDTWIDNGSFRDFFLYILARLLLLRATISSPALSFLIFAACLVGFGGLAYTLLTVAVGRIRGSFQP